MRWDPMSRRPQSAELVLNVSFCGKEGPAPYSLFGETDNVEFPCNLQQPSVAGIWQLVNHCRRGWSGLGWSRCWCISWSKTIRDFLLLFSLLIRVLKDDASDKKKVILWDLSIIRMFVPFFNFLCSLLHHSSVQRLRY